MTTTRPSSSVSLSMPRAALALAVGLGAWSGAPIAHAFWCEGSLVLEGDSMTAVRAACGEPATATTRVETRSYCSCCAGGHHHGYAYPGLVTTTTSTIDVWVYDFGYTRFMEQLEFEGGILRRLTRLGRGSRRRRDRVERDVPPVELPGPRTPIWRRDLGIL